MVDYKDEDTWLMQGDCLERMKEIPSGSVDMILCDPPYGTIACSWDSIIPFDKMWNELNRVIKQGSGIVLFGTEPFSSALRMSNIKNYKYDWKWDKVVPTNFLNAKRQPMRLFEDIIVFNSKRYYPLMTKRDKPITGYATRSYTNNDIVLDKVTRVYDEKYPVNKIVIKKLKGGAHPTQKPVELMEYLIKTYSSEGESVLDFTMGSGTTGVACANLGRKFIGVEMDENYFNVAKDRILNNKEN